MIQRVQWLLFRMKLNYKPGLGNAETINWSVNRLNIERNYMVNG